MPQTQLWIEQRLGEARTAQAIVTDAVASHIKDLLEGDLSSRSLSRGEMKDTATRLISEMVTSSEPDTEFNHED